MSGRRIGRLDESVEFCGPRSPFQRDYDRILFSSAFRRMQDKTQVFPLAKNDYVRTRLTHSLEVSSVGRSLGVMVGDVLLKKYSELNSAGLQVSDFGTIVAAACLSHDIGNPPFGHAGESAIQDWFRSPDVDGRYVSGRGMQDARQEDLKSFEGNAQGFRILTRLQFPSQVGGMQLSAAVLGAFAKYPRRSVVDLPGTGGISGKKFGFFYADEESFRQVAEVLELPEKADGAWYRHPLAFLMEAADDICYRIMDVEDGFRTGCLHFDEVRCLFEGVLDEPSLRRLDDIPSNKHKVEYLRAKAIDLAIREVVAVFLEREEAMLTGEFDDDLMSHVAHAAEFRAFKDLAREKVYSARAVVEVEACGYKVLGGLLDAFLAAIDDYASGGGKKASPKSKTMLRLLPEGSYREDLDFYERALVASDAVSGMTDSFALMMYQRIHGISLP
ncbi:deoxyguanosinetriphosphate triphosphohydrolase [Thauera sp. CAU 1555]|uniref:Deoxyguanosinetriphosphate triphosphohydrolase n=2 Tax=Thauera sedimentorum TaxID=2767595 RepID=A0ABR9B7Q4_9RHOO|nr:deoxyguanosinetriphosphate triphosphohydrolase [Thauera sedimentorum]MBD8501515.1 deoxyguanosinetriphosphate triphosphohydrolase [Thauera sedimentorum]